MYLFYRGNIASVILLKLYLRTSSTVNSGKLQDIGSTTVKICSLLRLRRKLLLLNPWIVRDIGLYSQLGVIYPLLGWGEIKGALMPAVVYVYNRHLSQCVQSFSDSVPKQTFAEICTELALCVLILVCTSSKYQFCWT